MTIEKILTKMEILVSEKILTMAEIPTNEDFLTSPVQNQMKDHIQMVKELKEVGESKCVGLEQG